MNDDRSITSSASQPQLVRGIRRWDLVALFINGIVGAGIFGLPANIYKLTGNFSLFAYLICAFLTVLVVLCFAELSSRYSETGGPYLYARAAFGSVFGFVVGWLSWLARMTAFAALCNLFVQYIGYFFPSVTGGWERATIITIVVGGLTLISFIGVRTAAIVSDVFTVGKLVPLLLFVIVGLCVARARELSFDVHVERASLSQAVMLLVFAFSGFEAVVITAGETCDPRRHMPFALMVSIAFIVVLYVLIQFVCINALGDSLATSERPLADAAMKLVGGAGATVISIVAILSVTGTMNGISFVSPRLLFAMAEQGQLPMIFAATHPRFRTPHVAILFTGAITFAMTLYGSFLSALTISTITRLIVYAATCAALPMLRRRREAPPAQFRVPLGTVVAIGALALCAWLLANSKWSEMRAVAIAAAAGLLLHAVFVRTTAPRIGFGVG